jgi:hypothetical protein
MSLVNTFTKEELINILNKFIENEKIVYLDEFKTLFALEDFNRIEKVFIEHEKKIKSEIRTVVFTILSEKIRALDNQPNGGND